MNQSLLNTHIKLLAFDLNSLTQIQTRPITFTRNNLLAVSHVEILGVVTLHYPKPDKFLRFTIDDGTASVPCILWLNQLTSNYFSRRNPSTVRLIADFASNRFAAGTKIGAVVRVRGRVSSFRGVLQVTVSDVVIEKDPNVEILHWLDCMRLARECYDVAAMPKPHSRSTSSRPAQGSNQGNFGSRTKAFGQKQTDMGLFRN